MEGDFSRYSLRFRQIIPQLQEQNLHHHQQQQTIDYRKLTSFLEYDNSFLSIWNWKPINNDNVNSSSYKVERRPRYMRFQSGSFFSRDVFYVKPEYMEFEQLFEQTSSSTEISDYEEDSSSTKISETSSSTEISDYEESLNFIEISDYEKDLSSTDISDYEEDSSSTDISDYEETSSSTGVNDYEEPSSFTEISDYEETLSSLEKSDSKDED